MKHPQDHESQTTSIKTNLILNQISLFSNNQMERHNRAAARDGARDQQQEDERRRRDELRARGERARGNPAPAPHDPGQPANPGAKGGKPAGPGGKGQDGKGKKGGKGGGGKGFGPQAPLPQDDDIEMEDVQHAEVEEEQNPLLNPQPVVNPLLPAAVLEAPDVDANAPPVNANQDANIGQQNDQQQNNQQQAGGAPAGAGAADGGPEVEPGPDGQQPGEKGGKGEGKGGDAENEGKGGGKGGKGNAGPPPNQLNQQQAPILRVNISSLSQGTDKIDLSGSALQISTIRAADQFSFKVEASVVLLVEKMALASVKSLFEILQNLDANMWEAFRGSAGHTVAFAIHPDVQSPAYMGAKMMFESAVLTPIFKKINTVQNQGQGVATGSNDRNQMRSDEEIQRKVELEMELKSKFNRLRTGRLNAHESVQDLTDHMVRHEIPCDSMDARLVPIATSYRSNFEKLIGRNLKEWPGPHQLVDARPGVKKDFGENVTLQEIVQHCQTTDHMLRASGEMGLGKDPADWWNCWGWPHQLHDIALQNMANQSDTLTEREACEQIVGFLNEVFSSRAESITERWYQVYMRLMKDRYAEHFVNERWRLRAANAEIQERLKQFDVREAESLRRVEQSARDRRSARDREQLRRNSRVDDETNPWGSSGDNNRGRRGGGGRRSSRSRSGGRGGGKGGGKGRGRDGRDRSNSRDRSAREREEEKQIVEKYSDYSDCKVCRKALVHPSHNRSGRGRSLRIWYCTKSQESSPPTGSTNPNADRTPRCWWCGGDAASCPTKLGPKKLFSAKEEECCRNGAIKEELKVSQGSYVMPKTRGPAGRGTNFSKISTKQKRNTITPHESSNTNQSNHSQNKTDSSHDTSHPAQSSKSPPSPNESSSDMDISETTNENETSQPARSSKPLPSNGSSADMVISETTNANEIPNAESSQKEYGMHEGRPFNKPDLRKDKYKKCTGNRFRAEIETELNKLYENTQSQKLMSQLTLILPNEEETINPKNREAVMASLASKQIKSSNIAQMIPLKCDICAACTVCVGKKQKEKCNKCKDCGGCKPFHVQEAMKLVHPAGQISLALPHHDAVYGHNADYIEKHSEEKLNDLRRKMENVVDCLVDHTKATNEFILNRVHPTIRMVLERFEIPSKINPDVPLFEKRLPPTNLALMWILLKRAGYKDLDVILDIAEGFKVAGPTTKSSDLWDPNPDYSEDLKNALPLDVILRDYEELNASSVDRANKMSFEVSEILWQETEKDLKRGIMLGPFSTLDSTIDYINQNLPDSEYDHDEKFGLLTPRFANIADRPEWDAMTKRMIPKKKYRPIDDSKSTRLNETHATRDKLRLPSVRSIACQTVLASTHHKTKLLSGWASDESAAFRSCPVYPSEARFVITSQKDPKTLEPAFTVLLGLIFGMSPSVYSYGRKSEVLAFLARTLTIPLDKYVDDSWCIEPTSLIQSSYDLFHTLARATGTNMEKLKDQTPAEKITLLGVQIHLRNLTFELTHEKKMQRKATVKQAIKENKLGRQEAERLAGRIQWCDYLIKVQQKDIDRGWSFRQAMSILRGHFRKKNRSTKIDDELEAALNVLLNAISNAKPVSFSHILKADPNNPVLTWTDGSDSKDHKGVGTIIIDRRRSKHHWRVGKGVATPQFLNSLDTRERQIVAIELRALDKTIDSNKDIFRNAYAIFFIDNQAAYSMLCRASARNADQDYLVSQITRKLEEVGCIAHYQFCPTGMNVSDLPSRKTFYSDPQKGMEFFKSNPAYRLGTYNFFQLDINDHGLNKRPTKSAQPKKKMKPTNPPSNQYISYQTSTNHHHDHETHIHETKSTRNRNRNRNFSFFVQNR